MNWKPVLDGAIAAKAQDVLGHIAHDLETPPAPYDGAIVDEGLRAALFSREPGFAVFYSYASRCLGDSTMRDHAIGFLETGLEQVESIAEYRPYFAFGFSGTAWAYEHLRDYLDPADEDEDEDEDILDDIDGVLEALVDSFDATCDLGVGNGVIGYGIYALERLPRDSARRLLQRVCELLIRSGHRVDDGMLWLFTSTQALTPTVDQAEKMVITSLDEGVSGVVALLAHARRHGVSPPGAEEAIEGGLAWLHRQIGPKGLPRFVGYDAMGGGWHGAPGTAAGLHAAVSGRHSALLQALRRVAIAQLEEYNPSPSFRMGWAGTAHALNRLYQQVGDEELRVACVRAYERLLDMHDPSGPVGGYVFHNPEWQSEFVSDLPTGNLAMPGITFGAAGIGLVLLSGLYPVEPRWDRMFLLSGRKTMR